MLLDEGEKLARHHAVDDAMVEAQAHVHHVPHRDAVADDDGATDDRLGGEDRRLRLIDDRLAGDRPRRARVVERERAALHIVRLQLFVARALDEVIEGAYELGEASLVGVLENRDDQSIWDRDRDAHVDIALENDRLVAPRRVEPWELLEGVAHDLHYEREVRERDAVAGLEAFLLGLAIAHEVGD